MNDVNGHLIFADHDLNEIESMEVPPVISSGERRMQAHAYNLWTSLLRGRVLPSITDVDPDAMEEFNARSVLLDISDGVDDPVIRHLGSALRQECSIGPDVNRMAQVSPHTLLARMCDYFGQIIENRAPVGFEEEMVNQRGAELLARGVLLPFSSDGQVIDYVYGVVNWKEVASRLVTDGLNGEILAAFAAATRAPIRTALSESAARKSEAGAWNDITPAQEEDFGFDQVDAATESVPPPACG